LAPSHRLGGGGGGGSDLTTGIKIKRKCEKIDPSKCARGVNLMRSYGMDGFCGESEKKIGCFFVKPRHNFSPKYPPTLGFFFFFLGMGGWKNSTGL